MKTITEIQISELVRIFISKLPKNWKNRFQMPKLEYRHYTMMYIAASHPFSISMMISGKSGKGGKSVAKPPFFFPETGENPYFMRLSAHTVSICLETPL